MWMAWNNVAENTITNYFRKCGFKQKNAEDVEENGNVIDIPNEIPEWWNEVTKSLNIEDLMFEELVSFDDDLAVYSDLSEKDIIASIFKDMSMEEAVKEDGEDESDS